MQKVISVTWDIYPRYFDNMDIMAENDKIATVQETLDLINNVKESSSTSTISSRTFAQKKDYMNSSDILSGINYFQKFI